MRNRFSLSFLVALWAGAGCSRPPLPPPPASPILPAPQLLSDPVPPLVYPPAPRGDVVDDYHGTRVPDPYRWLEDSDSPQTRAWIEAQNYLTFEYLSRIEKRLHILARMTTLWKYERHSPPFRQGRRYFYTKNDGLQNQNVLYVAESLTAEPRVLLDPNALSPDGTVALAGFAVSEDGRLLAYGLSTAGSDWQEWHVRNVDTGEDLPDVLRWIKFGSAAWTRDGRGFYYARFAAPRPGKELQDQNYFQKLYYHRLGDPQERDELVYERKDEKQWQFSPEVTEDGRYLIVTVHRGTDPRHRILYRDLRKKGTGLVELIDRFEHEYDFVGNDGPVLYFRTDREAPRRCIVAIDLRRPEPEAWREVVPQAAETLRAVSMVGDFFLASYLRDAHAQVKVFDRQGRLVHEVALPGLGTVFGLTGRRQDQETFYAYTSFSTPPTIYRLDLKTFQSSQVWELRLAFEPAVYETKQVFFRSRDGTVVPMFISYGRGLVPQGRAPTLLYGYGGFNVAVTPTFDPAHLFFMELGGVFAVANIRGGGEYGEEWHRAGTRLHKQRVFDDFIAAAEWLIENGYTRPSRLAIAGTSNGGLLVGACMTQRPDLFVAALPAVGVLDMLRFHKFTIGWAWADDYGTADSPEEFRALLAYSPLHNIRPGTSYPATLVTTADHDDRVVPAHSFKFTAALQAAQAGPAPVLIRIDTRSGHGAGKPTIKRIEEATDRMAFLQHVMKIWGRGSW